VRTVFLSSTSLDLQEFRKIVYEALCKFDGWHCYVMDNFTARAGHSAENGAERSALDYCREKTSECDVFVGLIGHCYGTTPSGDEVSFTEHEFDAASEKPRLMFVAPDDFPVPANLSNQQSDHQRRKQAAFRTRVLKASGIPGPPSSFETPDKLALEVGAALRNWEVEQEQLGRRPVVSSPSLASVGVNPATLIDRSVFKDVDQPWCPEMVVVQAGTFLMGSTDQDQDAYPEEKPQHNVTIHYRFALGRYPITFAEFDFFCEATGQRKPSDEGWGRGRRPVINVSWKDAQDFVQWLTKVTGKPYRLPSEAEWEYACRAGTRTRFWRGDHLSIKHANYDMDAGQTTEVGAYPANSWGFYDMHGNVWELVEDVFHDDYLGAPADGGGWTTGGIPTQRVVRGGSFSYAEGDNRSAVRCDHDSSTPDRQHGFRVARDLKL
jgi:formylglycine-generating enzyme required for sulfatase activity